MNQSSFSESRPLPKRRSHIGGSGGTRRDHLFEHAKCALQAQSRTRARDIPTKETVLKDALFQMRDAIDRYYAAKKQYPSSLARLVSEGYLNQIPTDPFTRRSDSWKTVPDPNKPADESAIFDIRSGSQARALDGTKYSAW